MAFFQFLLFFLILWAFIFMYVRNLRKEALDYWLLIKEKTRLRLDMVPDLIETARNGGFSEEKCISNIIKLRQISWPIEENSHQKVNNELMLSSMLRSIWQIVANNEYLKKDINFLSLKREIHGLEKEIEQLQDVYNQKIRSYNRKVNFVLLKPLLALIGLHPMLIFEFEA